MMTSISGELGTGKTYVLARELYRQSMAGCYCVSNFKHIYANKVVQNDPEQLLELIREIAVLKLRGGEVCDILPTFNHTGIFVAIDEAHLTFGRDSSKEQMEKIILPFISLARKQDVHIWYTCQDPATIHKTFRRYTRDWRRIRPVIPIFRTIMVPHESRPTWRREKRLLIHYVWEELHHLDYENPVFNYRTKQTEGGSVWHESSTIVSRRIRNNADPFYHSLYDSNEMSGINIDPSKSEDFHMLRDSEYIPSTLHKDPLPTLGPVLRFLGIPVRKMYIPERVRIIDWEIPSFDGSVRKVPKMEQKTREVKTMDILQEVAPKSLKKQEAKLKRAMKKRKFHQSKNAKKSAI